MARRAPDPRLALVCMDFPVTGLDGRAKLAGRSPRHAHGSTNARKHLPSQPKTIIWALSFSACNRRSYRERGPLGAALFSFDRTLNGRSRRNCRAAPCRRDRARGACRGGDRALDPGGRLSSRARQGHRRGGLHRAGHGRTAGRLDERRGLRSGEPLDLADPRCRGSDRASLSARDLLARHRSALGAPFRLHPLGGPSGKDRARHAACRPQALQRHASRPRRRGGAVAPARCGGRRRGARCCCRSPRSPRRGSSSPTS